MRMKRRCPPLLPLSLTTVVNGRPRLLDRNQPGKETKNKNTTSLVISSCEASGDGPSLPLETRRTFLDPIRLPYIVPEQLLADKLESPQNTYSKNPFSLVERRVSRPKIVGITPNSVHGECCLNHWKDVPPSASLVADRVKRKNLGNLGTRRK